MVQLAGPLVHYPARMLLTWYLSALLVGTVLLALPVSSADPDHPITLLDAFFTATSALCVTGLVVRDTGGDFSFVGQVFILGLIQIGGFGIMTLTTFVMSQLTGVSLRHRAVISETLGANPRHDLRWILFAVFVLTIFAEFIGAVLLFVRFLADYGPRQAIWQAVFHSVSAFCNAGFSLNSTSLVRYQSDLTVNFVIGGLIVIGGIGFPVLLDLLGSLRLPWSERWSSLHLHSKLTLMATLIVFVGGGLIFTALEWNGTLNGLSWPSRVMASFFHGVSCRTAGFNTIDVSALSNASLFVSVVLMVTGAGLVRPVVA